MPAAFTKNPHCHQVLSFQCNNSLILNHILVMELYFVKYNMFYII